jgi:hypothetical protein
LVSNTGEASQEPEIALDEVASSRALDAIRRDALDGLLALPRVGMGVGGFLAGIRRANVVQILDRIEIPCLHALGPGFLLTSEELENARKLAATAEPVEVLGMYISKTRGAPEPRPADLEALAALCPGEGQILLMIRPSTVEPVRAMLFMREPDGRVGSRFDVRMDGARNPAVDLEIAPEPTRAPAPPPNLPLQALKLTVPDSEQAVLGESKLPDVAAAGGPESPGARAPAMPGPATSPTSERQPDVNRTLPAPAASRRPAKEPEVKTTLPPRRHPALFQEYQQRESPRRAVLYTCSAVALIAAAAFAALDMLAPKPELTLNIREENGALVFRWNRNAAAGADRGRLLVNDAGQLHEFPLDAARIEAGFFQYRRKSDQIVAKLVLGDRSARAVFFGNSPKSGAGSRPDSGRPGESHTN